MCLGNQHTLASGNLTFPAMWLWSGSMHVSRFVFASACVSVFALSLSGRSTSPLLHHSPELSALSFSVSYGCVHLPSCFLIGCCRLLHWEGLLSQQHLNLGAGIFPLALVWKAERAREGWEKARASGRERGRGRERIRGLVSQTAECRLYTCSSKRILRRTVRETPFFFSSAFSRSLSLLSSFLSYSYYNALNRLSGEHNDN